MSEHTEGSVQDYFQIESHLLCTRSADAFKAIDLSRDKPVILWTLRHPLAMRSEAVRRFLSRMHVVHSVQPPIVPMIGFGVDSHGVAFTVLEPIDGTPIGREVVEPAEAERRFVQMVRAVDSLHRAGVVCGDLCAGSFLARRDGDIRIIGIMGSFDTEAAATAMLPPMDTLHFISPEQRSGGGVEPASDVYSLGVLAYLMFSGGYPHGPRPPLGMVEVSPYRSLVDEGVAIMPWLDSVIERALKADPSERFVSATALMQALSDGRREARDRAELPVVTRPARVTSGAEAAPAPSAVEAFAAVDAGQPSVQPAGRRNLARYLMVAVTACVCVVLVQVVTRRPASAPPVAEDQVSVLNVHQNVAASASLSEAIEAIANPQLSLAQREGFLDVIAASDDPIAHDVLVRGASQAATVEFRRTCERAILERARRLGYVRSAEVAKSWLLGISTVKTQLPAHYDAVLNSFDPTLPASGRGSALRRAYTSDAVTALRMSAAVALDSNQPELYREVLTPLIGDYLKIEGIGERSTLALILANADLTKQFGADILQRRDSIPDGDVIWALRMLAERGDSYVRPIASMAIDRGLVSKLRRVFLELVRDRADLPGEVVLAAVNAAEGSVSAESLAAFGRWLDSGSERILLAICADVGNDDIAAAAFETIAGRSLTIEPSASLVEWVRSNYWNERQHFVKAIGVMANLSLVEPGELQAAFDSFDRFAKDSRLIDLLLLSEDPAVVRMLVQRYAKMIGLARLLTLLSNQDREVRVFAVKALSAYNDVGALKMIIDQYEREKDPVVRQAFRDNFWVIQQREDAEGGKR